MKWQGDFNTKVYVRLGIALLVLVLVNVLGLFSLAQFSKSVSERAQLRQLSISLERVLLSVTTAETSERGFLITQSSEHLQMYQAAAAEVDRSLQELLRRAGQKHEIPLQAESLRPIVQKRMQSLQGGIQIAQLEGGSAARKAAQRSEGQILMEQLRRTVAGKQQLLTDYIRELDDAIAQTLSLARWTLILGNAFSLTLIGFAVWQLRREIQRRTEAETEIQKLNSRLQTQVAELNSLNKELEAFSYSVSHDLRAPLRHINGFVELLTESGESELNPKHRRYLSIISDSAKQMGRLIDDLLVFSRMGRTELKHTPVSLEELFDQAITELQHEAKGRRIEWKKETLPTVYGDRALLYQAVFNLVANAIKYTRPRDPAKIHIGCDTGKSGEAVCYVRDNGVGFDMSYADKLFGVFQRLHRSDEFEGTGIGLANVRRIIHRHGGRTWAEGKVDEGAIFYFTLPKRAPETLSRQTRLEKPEPVARIEEKQKEEERNASTQTHSFGRR